MTTATTPRERPIIMSAVSVRLILEGMKTQTRRAVKDERILIRTGVTNHAERLYRNEEVTHLCPYGRPGDRLWVREAWAPKAAGPYRFPSGRIWYRADPSKLDFQPKWRSPLFLPRALSRITLEINEVRVERVQAISEADAIAEGMLYTPIGTATWTNRQSFAIHWDQLNKKRGFSWESNPFVWAVTFRRIHCATHEPHTTQEG